MSLAAMHGPVVALSGGVGGAKLADGLQRVLPAGELTVIVNTGDDFEHLGMHISPDIDSVVYALAGLSDPVRGWGRRDETWQFMDALRAFGAPAWFQLGDKDLAMHVERTRRLAAGESLSAVTRALCSALRIPSQVLPMSDDAVRTRLRTDAGWLEFQQYFVREKCRPSVREIAFAQAERARMPESISELLARQDLRAVIVCPSNPFVSVDPILAIPGLRAALRACRAPVLGVTPIIGGRAVKGPAAKMMRELGMETSAAAIAARYADFIDAFVIDESDTLSASGVKLTRARTLMNSVADREFLARYLLQLSTSMAE